MPGTRLDSQMSMCRYASHYRRIDGALYAGGRKNASDRWDHPHSNLAHFDASATLSLFFDRWVPP